MIEWVLTAVQGPCRCLRASSATGRTWQGWFALLWEDGATRVNVGFVDLAATKSRIAIGHERLPDSDTAEEMRAWWRERVAALKPMLEGGGLDA